MNIAWPENLIHSLAERKTVIFIGAGVSATAKAKNKSDATKIPDWESFIRIATDLVVDDQVKEEIYALIDSKDLLLALQAIIDHSDSGDYSRLLNKYFNTQKFEASSIHKLIHELDSRVVITTNFDKLYENYCNGTTREDGYKTITYDNDSLCDEIRSLSYVIIKAHGTIDDVSRMIFTKQQYANVKYNHPGFYLALRSIFLTNLILFIGCSLTDPDVNLLLEEIRHVGKIKSPNYFLTISGQSKIRKMDLESSYGIKTIEYGNKYDDLEPALKSLLSEVESWRISFNPPKT